LKFYHLFLAPSGELVKIAKYSNASCRQLWNCTNLVIRGGSRPSARGPNYVMGFWSGAPNGVQGKAPGQRVSWRHFLNSETNFLTKLSHKFGVFILHGERWSTSAPAYNGKGSAGLRPSEDVDIFLFQRLIS